MESVPNMVGMSITRRRRPLAGQPATFLSKACLIYLF